MFQDVVSTQVWLLLQRSHHTAAMIHLIPIPPRGWAELEIDRDGYAITKCIWTCHPCLPSSPSENNVALSQAAAAVVAATLRNRRDHAEEEYISPAHFQAFDDSKQELLEQERVCALAVAPRNFKSPTSQLWHLLHDPGGVASVKRMTVQSRYCFLGLLLLQTCLVMCACC